MSGGIRASSVADLHADGQKELALAGQQQVLALIELHPWLCVAGRYLPDNILTLLLVTR